MAKGYWTAEPIWPGETCFIICGGPSLIGFDFDVLRHRNVIAVNSSVYSAPFADVCFYGDDRWGVTNANRLKTFSGLIVTTSSTTPTPDTKRMKKIAPPPALADSPDTLAMRRTSTQAAINLAVHFGVSRIVLMGVDMQKTEAGVTHHHAAHPWPSVEGCWDRQMEDLSKLAAPLKLKGVEVINTSMASRITWWPKQPIEELL
jgi:hypothetical protein